jgi:hypothetical protein
VRLSGAGTRAARRPSIHRSNEVLFAFTLLLFIGQRIIVEAPCYTTTEEPTFDLSKVDFHLPIQTTVGRFLDNVYGDVYRR